MYNRGGNHGVHKARLLRVLAEHLAHRAFILRRAIPFEVGELVLAFANAVERAVDDLHHNRLLVATDGHLLEAQSCHLAADSIGIDHQKATEEPGVSERPTDRRGQQTKNKH